MTWQGAGRRTVAGATAALLGAVWCATAPPRTAHAADTPQPYTFADDTRTVAGTSSSTGSRRLTPGATYKSSIAHPGAGGGSTELYYRLELGARENVYASVTALPGLGSRVGFADGIQVSVEDANGFDCDSGSVRFGASRSPRPLTASAVRDAGEADGRCARAGTYYVVVERTASFRSSMSSSTSSSTEKPSTPEDWDLELHLASEPALAKRGATTPPRTEDTVTPEPPAGPVLPRAGGNSFSTATALETGVWGDRLEPGWTRYYRVPVDWGQRLSATVELGGSGGPGGPGGREYVTAALVVSVLNPARGLVDDIDTSYDGRQKSTALPTLPPVTYENRYAPISRVAEVRFAGWYYLAVSLDPDVEQRFGDGAIGLTLRVGVTGERHPAPAYAGTARPGDEFGVTERDEEAARGGAAGSADDGGRTPRRGEAAAGGTGDCRRHEDTRGRGHRHGDGAGHHPRRVDGGGAQAGGAGSFGVRAAAPWCPCVRWL
ncbi:hypothetical protein RB200_09870 [Streptomyces sp. PmtG]